MVLIADEQEIYAHKAVLSACSPYFHAMFTCELAESSSDRITLQEVDGYALAQLIDFVYTSEVLVTEDNVQVSSSSMNPFSLFMLHCTGMVIGFQYYCRLFYQRRICCSYMRWRRHAVISFSHNFIQVTV